MGLANRLRKLLKKPTRGRALVLLYHRIATPLSDPQLLSVSPNHFKNHLEWLSENYPVIPFKELVSRLIEGTLPDGAVSITFDDGYKDNLVWAKPILERFSIPATVFVSSGHVTAGREFWWDTLERTFLRPGILPEMVRIEAGGHMYESEVRPIEYDQDSFRQHRQWNVLLKKNPTKRHEIYREVLEMLRPLPPKTISDAIVGLSSWAALDATDEGLPLNPAELVRLAEGDLIEIGAHSVNHPVLSFLDETKQADEINEDKAALGNIIGRTISAFSYPFGGPNDYDDRTVSILQSAGFECACTTSHSPVRENASCWRLPRLIVRDWDVTTFADLIQKWWYAQG